MFSKAVFTYKISVKSFFSGGHICLFCFFLAAGAGCKLSESSDGIRRAAAGPGPAGMFNVPGQIFNTGQVHSIQFFRKGNPESPPMLSLTGPGQLRLQFETLQFDSRQFRVSFSHHNPDWSRSSLPPEFFSDGIPTRFITGGQPSRNQRPYYRQFTFDFPGEGFSFTRSGNYMLRVEDQDNGHVLFTLPFFVYENEGAVVSRTEEITAPRQNLRITHQPSGRYRLPDFVEQPQFDLEFYFVQNRFWGRSRQADELDFSDENESGFILSRENSFTGDYEFLALPLGELSQSNPKILDVDLGSIPPEITLRDDAQGFSASGNAAGYGPFGRPDMDLAAQYANVIFNFQPDAQIPENGEIYLVGDFNNWSIQSANRLSYNTGAGRWQTEALIKQGGYRYKYVLFEDNQIQDLYFDDRFSRSRQEYHAFVYMRDTQRFYYRLLQVHQFYAGS